VTLVGSAELAALAEAALSGNEISDKDIASEIAALLCRARRRPH